MTILSITTNLGKPVSNKFDKILEKIRMEEGEGHFQSNFL